MFAGGEEDDVARARELLDAFAARITHLGPSGSGQLGKAVNQVMISGTYATVAEGLALAESAGMPLAALIEALSGGAAGSWVLEHRAGNMVADEYPLGFRVDLHRKDLAIALEEADRLGRALAVSRLVLEQEDRLITAGHGGEDVSAVARVAKGEVP